jgi:Response regulator of citrate/malate metabolism
MALQQISILLIEDDEDDAFLIKDYLSDIHNFEIKLDWEPDYNNREGKIMNGSFDLFLIDFYLGKETGLNLIGFIQKQGVFTPAILLTGRNDSQIDIDASTAGAFDYLVKGDLNSDILERSIRYSSVREKLFENWMKKKSAIVHFLSDPSIVFSLPISVWSFWSRMSHF